MKGDSNGKTGEDEICRIVKRVAKRALVNKGTLDHHHHRFERILANDGDNDP